MTMLPGPDDWVDSFPGVVKKSLLRSREPGFAERKRKVAAGQTLPSMPRTPGVWAIAMVKNEADIIEAVVRHTFAQGVDRLLIADNGSTDGTADLLLDLSREFPMSIGHDSEVGYYQDHKMTALAHAARAHGANWIIPIDADEFWYAPGELVGDYLRSRPARETRTTATMYNVFPTPANPSPGGLGQGQLRFDLRPNLLPKVATRPHPLLWIGMGNHWALRPGIRRSGLYIAHLPWRSFEQYRRKVKQGAKAFEVTDLAENLGGHWRQQGRQDEEGLRKTWESLLQGEAERELGWRPIGPFVSIALGDWRTWDPQGIIRSAVPPVLEE